MALATESQPASTRSDLLPDLIRLFYAVAPLEVLMVFAGATEVTAGMAAGTFIGISGLFLVLSSRLGLSWQSDRPIAYMTLFLLAGTLSTLLSPYGAPVIQRGAVNLASMVAFALMALVVGRAFVQWPQLLPYVVRIAAISTGIAALTVVYHFVVANLLMQPQLFDLTFINAIWGNTWWLQSEQGGFVRAQGAFREPSYLAAYIGMGAGLALTRLGAFGARLREALRAMVPFWAALSILAALILSASAVVYAGLLAAWLGSLASKTTFSTRSVILFVIGAVAAVSILLFLALQAGDVIMSRVMGMAVLSQLNSGEGTGTLDNDINLSVRIVFLNAYVTLQNLTANPWLGVGVGAHPLAYTAVLADVPALSLDEAAGFNSMDASALVLRLLSETGILGTILFTAALLSAALRLRKIAISAGFSDLPLKAIAVALNGSLVGVFAALLLHIPHYYSAPFWGLFALCTAIPLVASMPSRASFERAA